MQVEEFVSKRLKETGIMKCSDLIEKVYDHLDRDDIEKAVMTCIRIARHLHDYYSTILFFRELYPDKRQIQQNFFNETQTLTEKAQKLIWDKTFEDWVEGRTIKYSSRSSYDDEPLVFTFSVGQFDHELKQREKSIADLVIPTGMGEFDTAAFTDRYDTYKAQHRLQIQSIQTIRTRIKTRCFNYASRIEKQLEAQSKPVLFLETIQNEVNNYFGTHCEEVYNKLQKASQLINSSDDEDQALLLTTVRKAINAIADYFYPPVNHLVLCKDGKERKMGSEQYLNRLQEYLASNCNDTSADELLEAELDHLVVFARRLNAIASKGVHTSVSSSEAKQGLVGLYMFLFNLIYKIQNK